MSAEQPQVIAHRGLRNQFPENSLEALSAAIEAGVAGVEFDVELTRDGELAVLHQQTLAPGSHNALQHADRDLLTTWVRERTLAELRSLDAGSWFAPSFQALKIPSLEEALQLPWQNCAACIELKDPYYWEQRNLAYEHQVQEALSRNLAQSPRPKRLRLLSFNEYLLEACKESSSEIELMLNVWLTRPESPAEILQIAKGIGARIVGLAEPMILKDETWLARAHEAGLQIHVYPVTPARDEEDFSDWTVEKRAPVWKSLMEIGVDGIISDFPAELLAFLANQCSVK